MAVSGSARSLEQDVAGLQVAVEDPPSVRVWTAPRQSSRSAGRRSVRTGCCCPFSQVESEGPFAIRRGDVGDRPQLAGLVDRDNVRVVEDRRSVGLRMNRRRPWVGDQSFRAGAPSGPHRGRGPGRAPGRRHRSRPGRPRGPPRNDRAPTTTRARPGLPTTPRGDGSSPATEDSHPSRARPQAPSVRPRPPSPRLRTGVPRADPHRSAWSHRGSWPEPIVFAAANSARALDLLGGFRRDPEPQGDRLERQPLLVMPPDDLPVVLGEARHRRYVLRLPVRASWHARSARSPTRTRSPPGPGRSQSQPRPHATSRETRRFPSHGSGVHVREQMPQDPLEPGPQHRRVAAPQLSDVAPGGQERLLDQVRGVHLRRQIGQLPCAIRVKWPRNTSHPPGR